jgi:hypothetical protein
MKEEQGLLIQQKKKSWMQQGWNPWPQGERPAPKPLINHENLLILRAWFFHLGEFAVSEFWLNLQHCRRPKQTFVKYASLIYEPGATKLLFFLKQRPKKRRFSLTVSEMSSATANSWKNDVSNYGINL